MARFLILLIAFFKNLYLIILGCIAAFLLVMWALCLNDAKFYELIKSNPAMFVDFCKIYVLSKMVCTGHGYAVYDPETQKLFLQQFLPPNSLEGFFSVPYPPYVYGLFVPFALMPIVLSYGMWTAVTALVGITGAIVLRRRITREDSRLELVMLAVWPLSTVFYMNNMLLGQAGFLILGLVSFFFAALLAKNDTISGITMGLCAVKFQFLLLMGTPSLIMKKVRAIFIAAVIGLSFLMVSVGTVGLQNTLNYPNVLKVQEIFHPNTNIIGMINMRGWLFTVTPSTDHLNAMLSGVVALILIFWLWIKADTSERRLKAMSLSIIAYLIFSPHAYSYDALLLTVSCVTTLRRFNVLAVFSLPTKGQKLQAALLILMPFITWVGYFAGNEIFARLMLVADISLLILGLTDYLSPRLPTAAEATLPELLSSL